VNDLVNQLVEQLGLPEEVAAQAVTIVMGFLKTKLPDPIANQLDGLLGDNAEGAVSTLEGLLGGSSNAGGILGQLGGLFGGGDKN
jgi:hypothetical protein